MRAEDRKYGYIEGILSIVVNTVLFALKMCKQAANQSVDAQGQWQAMEAAFSLHQLCHSHNVQVHKIPVNPAGLLPPKKKAQA